MILWFRDLNFLKQWYKPVAVFHCTKNEVIEEIFDGKLHFLWGLLMNVRSEKNHENATKHLCWSPQKQPPRGVHMKSCFATLLNSPFAMGVLLQICCIFSEQLFSRTSMGGCFWSRFKKSRYFDSYQILA